MGLQVANIDYATPICECCDTRYCEKCQHHQSKCIICTESYCRERCGDDVKEGGTCNLCKEYTKVHPECETDSGDKSQKIIDY